MHSYTGKAKSRTEESKINTNKYYFSSMAVKTAKYITNIHITSFTFTVPDIIATIKNQSHDIDVISIRELKNSDWSTCNWLVDTNISFTGFAYLGHLYQVVPKPTQRQKITTPKV
jgi:hypothetical protein